MAALGVATPVRVGGVPPGTYVAAVATREVHTVETVTVKAASVFVPGVETYPPAAVAVQWIT